ncbi:MAG TPA: Smr/MutS family protein [Saprospiraceae bacterium]|nr:Smr/MutS family protein [Saprospiraceae bacterium]
MAKLKLDLHPIFNKGKEIELALNDIVAEAEECGIKEIEIIPGKGSGVLKEKVLRWMNSPPIKNKIHRSVKDSKNWGRLFLYLK